MKQAQPCPPHHALHAVRQQQHDAVLSNPLGLTGTDELVDDALCRVVKISKLSLPQDQSIGTCHCETQLKACRQTDGETFKDTKEVHLRTNELRQTVWTHRGRRTRTASCCRRCTVPDQETGGSWEYRSSYPRSGHGGRDDGGWKGTNSVIGGWEAMRFKFLHCFRSITTDISQSAAGLLPVYHFNNRTTSCDKPRNVCLNETTDRFLCSHIYAKTRLSSRKSTWQWWQEAAETRHVLGSVPAVFTWTFLAPRPVPTVGCGFPLSAAIQRPCTLPEPNPPSGYAPSQPDPSGYDSDLQEWRRSLSTWTLPWFTCSLLVITFCPSWEYLLCAVVKDLSFLFTEFSLLNKNAAGDMLVDQVSHVWLNIGLQKVKHQSGGSNTETWFLFCLCFMLEIFS